MKKKMFSAIAVSLIFSISTAATPSFAAASEKLELDGASTLAGTLSLNASNDANSGVINMFDNVWLVSNGKSPNTSAINTSDGIKVTDYASLSAALSVSGAKIYVMNDINCGDRISLSSGNQSIIGVPKSDGTLPVLNFENMAGQKDIINETSSDSDVGVRITSSKNTVSNLVIEFAHDNGIQIKGEKATDNTISNCIVRYNNDSGIQITGGAYNNALKNVYSYRNCDVYSRGGNADGFAIKLGAGPALVSNASEFQNAKNTFENCFAWENSDDAWDSYDKEDDTAWTYKNEYTDCMCWGNGSAATHLGYTDYINSQQLDENLPVIRRIKALVDDSTYEAFKTAYNKGTLGSRTMSEAQYYATVDRLTKVSIPTNKKDDSGNLLNLSVTDFVANWGGNPNGFKMGSKFTQHISERTLTNCIAFDHSAYGFDKNNSTCNVEIGNAISFDNGTNYHLEGMTAGAWEKVYGWDGKNTDDLAKGASGVNVKVERPTNTGKTEKLVRAAAADIVAGAADNKIVETNVFSTVFK